MYKELMSASDIELILKIANIDNLNVVYRDGGSIMVEPYEGGVVEYNPIKDNTLE